MTDEQQPNPVDRWRVADAMQLVAHVSREHLPEKQPVAECAPCQWLVAQAERNADAMLRARDVDLFNRIQGIRVPPRGNT